MSIRKHLEQKLNAGVICGLYSEFPNGLEFDISILV